MDPDLEALSETRASTPDFSQRPNLLDCFVRFHLPRNDAVFQRSSEDVTNLSLSIETQAWYRQLANPNRSF